MVGVGIVRWSWVVAVVIALALCVFWESRITGAPIQSDSVATLQMGVNLAHHGVLSIDEQAPYQPSMYREPLPGVIAALMVIAIDMVKGPAELHEYLQGPRAQWIKQQNLLWFLLLYASTVAAVVRFTHSAYPGAVAGLLAQGFYFYPGVRAFGIDTLFSDIPAAAVLTFASLLLARALIRVNWRQALLAGLCFGALTLIKAALLYVFVGIVVVGMLFYLLRRADYPVRASATALAALVAGFAVVVTPWLARNASTFGVVAVADRGGLSLYTRVLKDQMSDAEYAGSFYAWTPSVLRPLVGSVTDFGPQDLQRGGLLQHLYHSKEPSPEYDQERAAERAGRPDQAVAYYFKARAERVRLWQEYSAAGHARPWLASDQALQQRATRYMLDHPLTHLKLAVPFMWRGALLIFPVLLAVLAFALWRRLDELWWYCLPAFGLIMFYALFANFEERYGTPALPAAVASGIIMLLSLTAGTSRPQARTRG